MMAHVMIMRTCGVVMEVASREGHASSSEAAGNLLIGLLLIIIEIAILPFSHLSPDSRNPPNGVEKVAPTQHVQADAYEKISAVPSLYAEVGAPRKVLLDKILCS
jgi:hypothetical protein